MSKMQKGFYDENFLGNDTFTDAENQFRVVLFCVIIQLNKQNRKTSSFDKTVAVSKNSQVTSSLYLGVPRWRHLIP